MTQMKFGIRINRSMRLAREVPETRLDGTVDHGEIIITPYRTLSWDLVKNVTLECERLGYDLITVPDHLKRSKERLESWTTLSALASVTEKIRLSTQVLCNEWRHPPLLAKMAASLDFISNGRLELGLGTGYNQAEFDAYGFYLPSAGTRVRRLSEAVQILKKMWTEDEPSFEGRYYRINKASCDPKPIQKPHCPIMIGGTGKKMLGLVARYADAWNDGGTVEYYKSRIDVLEKACDKIGRDPDEIEKSWGRGVQIFLYADEKEFDERVSPMNKKLFKERKVLKCTPEELTNLLHEYTEIGVTKSQLHFIDLPDMRGVRLFAKEVMPKFHCFDDSGRK